MPYWFNLDNGRLFAIVCGANLALAGLAAAAGFMMALGRGAGWLRSARIGALAIFFPLLMPAGACALLILSYVITSDFLAESVTTTGEVIDLAANHDSDGTTYSAVVRFTTPAGQAVTFEDSSKGCDPPCNQVGDRVPIRYRTANPEDAIISGGIDIWLTTGVFGLLTVVFLGTAAILGWSAYRRKAQGDLLAF
jgi:hypothetical protein